MKIKGDELMFSRYCKRCAHPVDFEYGMTQTYCPKCDTSVQRIDTIAGHTREARINQLKAMHTLMLLANDEGIYMSWILYMPDEPTDDDFIDIAMDDKQYNECFDKFVKLIAKEGNRY